ncbi:unnamed protein product [Rhizophagus irregularis]|nr:unnamed protein product [Rhizophagus irregularis]CAB5307979.1 unnamed protein product [Rhizophagus irregularis]
MKSSIGLSKNENPNIKILSSGGFLKIGKMRTFKIRKFGVSEFPKNESPKNLFVNRKLRFISFRIFGKSGTKIRLVSQADSKEQYNDNSENEKWIEAIKCENTFDYFEDKILLDSEMNNDFNFGGRTIHLVDDLTAKWLLQSLFISNLEFSAYLQENQIYSAL